MGRNKLIFLLLFVEEILMIISPSVKMTRDLKFQRCSGTKLILLMFYFLLNLGDYENILDLYKVREACTLLNWTGKC